LGNAASPVRQDHHSHNPITNPIPGNVQNPYFSKVAPNGAHQTRNNYFASVANNNLLGSSKQAL